MRLPSGRRIPNQTDNNYSADDLVRDLVIEVLRENINLSNGRPISMCTREDLIMMRFEGMKVFCGKCGAGFPYPAQADIHEKHCEKEVIFEGDVSE